MTRSFEVQKLLWEERNGGDGTQENEAGKTESHAHWNTSQNMKMEKMSAQSMENCSMAKAGYSSENCTTAT